jgi:hypothetical protein
MKRMLALAAFAMLAATAGVHAGNDPGAILLEANFNDKPLDQQIGTGGPELGEPIEIFPGLSAIVRAAPMSTPSLELSHATSGNARYARFEFLGSEEVTHGDLAIHLRIEAAQFDMFSVNVREQGTSAQSFTSVLFTGSGDISATDANGPIGIIGSYSVNVVHQLALLFHMDDGTYDINLDGTSLLDARAHGITGRGVGSVLVGTSSSTTPGALFYVDRLRVTRGDGIFQNGFE